MKILIAALLAAVPVVAVAPTDESEECLSMLYEAGLLCNTEDEVAPVIDLNGYHVYSVSDGFVVYKDGKVISVSKTKVNIL